MMNESHGNAHSSDEALRQLRTRIEAAITDAHSRVERLTHVLAEFPFYSTAIQLDLTDIAVIWAFVSLSSVTATRECEDSFYSLVDVMYASSDHAAQSLSDAERERLTLESRQASNDALSAMNSALVMAARTLVGLPEDNYTRKIAELLQSIRRDYIEHADIVRLRDMIAHCVLFTTAAANYHTFVRSEEAEKDFLSRLQQLAEAALTIHKDVHAAIRAGRLLVRDGKIINPCDMQ